VWTPAASTLILATLAVGAGLDRRIGPFVALYVILLAVTGPLLTARSRRLARLLPARLFPPVPAEPPVAVPLSRPDEAPRPSDGTVGL
jgi:CPA2 family monovalent cation:H+ antiporter-2